MSGDRTRAAGPLVALLIGVVLAGCSAHASISIGSSELSASKLSALVMSVTRRSGSGVSRARVNSPGAARCWTEAPPADLGLRPWTLAVVVVGVAVVTAVSCAVVFTRFGRGARPAALRAAER